MILQSMLSKLSNRLFKENGGRRIPESVLERDYCIAWFLNPFRDLFPAACRVSKSAIFLPNTPPLAAGCFIGLAKTPLKNKIIFKGGTALRRCYFEDYRFSEDLDFTLLQLLR